MPAPIKSRFVASAFITKWQHTSLRWALGCVIISSVACTVWFAVWLWAWLNRPFVQPEPLVAEPASKAEIDFSAAAHLLGAQSSGQTTPPTVTLAGVMSPTAGSTRAGAAVLSIEGQAPKALKLGDTVAPGWVLAEIGATHVVLKNQSLNHRVDLPKPSPLEGLQAVAQPMP